MLRGIRAILIDLSGTLHVENTPTPNAVTSLATLRQQRNLEIRFVTNTTKESRASLVTRLRGIGFGIQDDEIVSSLSVAREFVRNAGLNPFLMLSESAMEDFSGLTNENKPRDAVVVGLAPEKFDYATMNEAFHWLEKGAKLIAIHRGRYFKRESGLSLGPGAFVRALEYATGTESILIGKPEPTFFKSALSRVGCRAEETVMIGDDVRDDVLGAQSVGMKGVLVRTGKYQAGDEMSLQDGPWMVVDSFAEFVDLLVRDGR